MLFHLANKLPYDENNLFARIAQDDDSGAYYVLYTFWHKKVYSYIYAITSQRILSEEGTQEVFIIIWRQRNKLPEIRNFEAWLFVLVRRHTLNLLRKIANEKKLIERFRQFLSQKNSHTFNDQIENSEQRRISQQAINRLPPQQKVVYELSYLEGMSRNEIAEKLDLSPNTVKNHLNAAVVALRNYLQHHYSDGLLLVFFQYLVDFF